jgi:hypothetical protein
LISFASAFSALRICALISFMFVLLAPQAKAACLQWNLAGHWQIYQDNGFRTLFDLQQTAEGTLQGTGSYSSTSHRPIGGDFLEGRGPTPVHGAVQNNDLYLRTDWYGTYDGQIAPDGSVSGTTSSLGDPDNKVPWHVENRKAPCLRVRTPTISTTPAPPKKTVTLGRKEHATATDDADIYVLPDGNSAVVGFLRKGQVCRVLEGDQNGFYKLVFRPEQIQRNPIVQNVTQGWVTKDLLSVVFK